jgi:hypothetical protein
MSGLLLAMSIVVLAAAAPEATDGSTPDVPEGEVTVGVHALRGENEPEAVRSPAPHARGTHDAGLREDIEEACQRVGDAAPLSGPVVFGLPVKASFWELACAAEPLVAACEAQFDQGGMYRSLRPGYPMTVADTFKQAPLWTIACEGPLGVTYFAPGSGRLLAMEVSAMDHELEADNIAAELMRKYGKQKRVRAATLFPLIGNVSVYRVDVEHAPGALFFLRKQARPHQALDSFVYRDEAKILELARAQHTIKKQHQSEQVQGLGL